MKPHAQFMRIANWFSRHKTLLTASFALLVMVIAAIALRAILKDLHWDDIELALRRVRPYQIALSLILTAVSYFVLTGYDVLALHAIKKPQRYWRAALASFSAYCLSHNLGFAPITGTAARWRAYSGTDMNIGDVVRVVLIAGLTFWMGIFLLLGISLMIVPGALRIYSHSLPFLWQSLMGASILVGIIGYLHACYRMSKPLMLFGWSIPIPSLNQAIKQFLLAATDISIASAALLVLLPADAWHHYPDFLVAYVIAMVVALLTHAPGGLGVFEAVILTTLPNVPKPDLVSALILYRVIYYWLPLISAVSFLGVHELNLNRHKKNIQL